MMGLNNFSKNVFYGAMGLAFMMGASSAQAVIVELNDNKDSSYEIVLVSHVGATWTYRVKELSGRSLSHWNLGIPNCIGHLVSQEGPGTSFDDKDGSTGFEGFKWDVAESFTEGEFSVTLDGNYQSTTIQVQAKAGNNANTGELEGPDCSQPDNDLPDVDDPLAISLSDLDIKGNTVKWSTDLEHNNAGYHVWVRCPRVAAAGPGNYEFKLTDCTAVKGIVLEDVDNAGRSSFHMDLMTLD
jgi:hypothetical protein